MKKIFFLMIAVFGVVQLSAESISDSSGPASFLYTDGGKLERSEGSFFIPFKNGYIAKNIEHEPDSFEIKFKSGGVFIIQYIVQATSASLSLNKKAVPGSSSSQDHTMRIPTVAGQAVIAVEPNDILTVHASPGASISPRVGRASIILNQVA